MGAASGKARVRLGDTGRPWCLDDVQSVLDPSSRHLSSRHPPRTDSHLGTERSDGAETPYEPPPSIRQLGLPLRLPPHHPSELPVFLAHPRALRRLLTPRLGRLIATDLGHPLRNLDFISPPSSAPHLHRHFPSFTSANDFARE